MLRIDPSSISLRAITLGVLILLSMASCKDDATFAAEQKMAIDTTFISIKLAMQTEIDSLCLINNEVYYQAIYDSIMDARIADIESLLEAAKAKTSGL